MSVCCAMNEHDLVTGADPIRCACGRSWPDLSPEKARAAHDVHFQVERLRAALRGDKEETS